MRNFFNLTIIYVSVLTLVFSQTMPAYAGLIGTEQFMANHIADQNRQTLHNVLERDDARKLLEKHGVSTEQAQERIDAMTNEEVRIMAQKFDSLPKYLHSKGCRRSMRVSDLSRRTGQYL